MTLFRANHTLTQGSLHYRLATLGYQNATPTVLKRAFLDTIHFILQHESLEYFVGINIIYNIDSNNL